MSCDSPIPNCQPCQDCPPTGVTYTLPDCPAGEKCESLSQADCVAYKGPNLPALGILNNDRLITVLTKLHKAIATLQPGGGPAVQNFTVTCTPPTGTTTPFKITYLGVQSGLHKIFEITVLPNAPQTISAFPGSAVTISGTGTIV